MHLPKRLSNTITAAKAVVNEHDDDNDMDTDSDHDDEAQHLFTTPHTAHFTTFAASTTADTDTTMLETMQTSVQGEVYVVSNYVNYHLKAFLPVVPLIQWRTQGSRGLKTLVLYKEPLIILNVIYLHNHVFHCVACLYSQYLKLT